MNYVVSFQDESWVIGNKGAMEKDKIGENQSGRKSRREEPDMN